MMPPSAPTLGPRSALGDPLPLLAIDGAALQRHLRRCASARGPCFGLRCLAEGLHAFLAPRMVTTLAVATCAFGLASLMA